MTVLYRKYRPQAFSEVSGQAHIKATLAQEVASGSLAHSYLFTGPRGVGKTSLARILAKAVNCTGRAKDSGEPCGTCELCLEITEGRCLDVIEIDAASHTGVEHVREQVIDRARFAPSKARYKVYVIDEVHMLSTSAFNALLKTLEEPPSHVIFILATTELHKLPATIVSRCQRFEFRRIPAQELSDRLAALSASEGFDVAPEVIEAICGRSEGCLRDAESLLSQLMALGSKKITVETAALVLPAASSERLVSLAQAVIARDVSSALSIWDSLVRDGSDLSRAVSDLTELVRRNALAALRGTPAEFAVAPGDAAALLKRLTSLRDEMRREGSLPELPFEVMAMEWAQGTLPSKPLLREEGLSASGGRGVLSGDSPKPPAAISPPPSAPPLGSRGGKMAAEPLRPAATSPLQEEGNKRDSSISIGDVRSRWQEVVRKAQDRHHSLPYMLGATELLSCENNELVLGFQYPLYRDRLNDLRHRGHLEGALADVFGAGLRVKAVLVAQKVDGTVEPMPSLVVAEGVKQPDGFAELVKEFGASF